MRATAGQYSPRLDQLRALAAFMVFTWHLTRPTEAPGPAALLPLLAPLQAPFQEGHCGVSLFFAISGTLFGRLLPLAGPVRWGAFAWNRALRLAPLMLVVMALVAAGRLAAGRLEPDYLQSIALGLVLPSWPHGGWSVTAELHCYALLPMLLWLRRRHAAAPLALVALALAIRAGLYAAQGEVMWLTYWTALGRLDPFVLGFAAAGLRVRAGPVVIGMLLLCAAYAGLLAQGGYWSGEASQLWVVLPTIEGAAFASLVAWFDAHPSRPGRLGPLLARAGECSYSLYLLHGFAIPHLTRGFAPLFAQIGFEASLLGSALGFAAFTPIAWLSYRWIERPALAWRRPYLPGPP